MIQFLRVAPGKAASFLAALAAAAAVATVQGWFDTGWLPWAYLVVFAGFHYIRRVVRRDAVRRGRRENAFVSASETAQDLYLGRISAEPAQELASPSSSLIVADALESEVFLRGRREDRAEDAAL